MITFTTSLGINCFIIDKCIYIQQQFKNQVIDEITILELNTLTIVKYNGYKIDYLVNSKYLKKFTNKGFIYYYGQYDLIEVVLKFEIKQSMLIKKKTKEVFLLMLASVILATIMLIT